MKLLVIVEREYFHFGVFSVVWITIFHADFITHYLTLFILN